MIFGAQNEIRTRTSLRMPPPQDGASTNFATWACLILKSLVDSRESYFLTTDLRLSTKDF